MIRQQNGIRWIRRGSAPGLALVAVLALGGCAATQDAGDMIGDTIDRMRGTDWDTVSENWDEFQDSAADYWSELSEDDLESIDGDRDSLIEELSEAYEISEPDAERSVDAWVDTL